MATVYSGVGTKMAKLPGVQPLLEEGAQKIKAKAEANAAAHRKTGRYSGAFRVRAVPGKKGVVDRIVENTHPAANAIEFGHRAVGRDGEPGRFVPGQFNLTRAL